MRNFSIFLRNKFGNRRIQAQFLNFRLCDVLRNSQSIRRPSLAAAIVPWQGGLYARPYVAPRLLFARGCGQQMAATMWQMAAPDKANTCQVLSGLVRSAEITGFVPRLSGSALVRYCQVRPVCVVLCPHWLQARYPTANGVPPNAAEGLHRPAGRGPPLGASLASMGCLSECGASTGGHQWHQWGASAQSGWNLRVATY